MFLPYSSGREHSLPSRCVSAVDALLEHYRVAGRMMSTPVLNLLTLFVAMETASSAANRTINLGLVTPLTGKTGFLQVAAASTMGVETAKENGYLNGTDIM